MISHKSYAVVAPSESSAAAANLKEAMIYYNVLFGGDSIQMMGCDEPWVSQLRYAIYSALSIDPV
eukprot:scaffold72939_cov61-Cyclotella_meneghiniana.AAC.2